MVLIYIYFLGLMSWILHCDREIGISGRFLKWNKLKIINVIYAYLIVNIGWVFFRADNIYIAFDYKRRQCGHLNQKYTICKFFIYESYNCIFTLVLYLWCPHYLMVFGKIYEKIKNNHRNIALDLAVYMSLLLYSIITITSGTYNPFIYFQF